MESSEKPVEHPGPRVIKSKREVREKSFDCLLMMA